MIYQNFSGKNAAECQVNRFALKQAFLARFWDSAEGHYGRRHENPVRMVPDFLLDIFLFYVTMLIQMILTDSGRCLISSELTYLFYFREGGRMRPEEIFLGDKYVLKRQIGQGGMGKVYLAADRKLHKKWAVKEICCADRSVEAELMVLKKADHRNLPRIVDILQKGNKTYIVMDYIEGESLKDRIVRTGGLSVPETVRCGRELADVLDYLHHLNPPVIYRDMKPSNIILRKDGSAVLVDFGTAKAYDGICDDTVSLGTRDYASPEQFEGRSDVRSDIYALGRTLTECMAKPARGGRPSGLLRILRRCTKQNPAKRYQTARMMLKALEKLERRKEGRVGKLAAGAASVFFAAAILAGSRGRDVQETGRGPDLPAEQILADRAQTQSLRYEEQIGEILSQADISWDEVSSVLTQFSEYTKNLTDEKERLKNAVFMAEIYLSYGNHSEESLKKAAVLLRREESVWNRKEDGSRMDDKEECLLMLSAIFRMLGKQEEENREVYYRKSIDYAREYLEVEGVREERMLYGRKVADVAAMLEEIGDMREARKYYLQWEQDYPCENMEIYLSHMDNLFASGAGKEELEQLINEARKVEGMEGNEQFERMEKRFEVLYGGSLHHDDNIIYE